SEVRQLNAEQRQAWVEAMKPVWKQFEADVPAELIEAAQSFNQTN
ncbi:MAG: C4-dicarboxylate ABC transporter, partial [Pseudomonadota bacterium]